jgi:MFS family permease
LAKRSAVQLLLLAVAVFAANYARTALGPLQEAMRAALGLSDNQMAILQGPALALPVVLTAIPLGFLIDRYSRVKLLLVFAGVDMVGSLLTAAAPNFASISLARCLVGLTATATFTAALSLLGDLCAPHRRGRAAMVISISQIAGTSAAFALGGSLLAIFGATTNAWRWTMVWASAPLLVALFAITLMREPVRTDQQLHNPTARKTWIELWAYRAVILPTLVGVVMAEIALGAIQIWAAPALARHFHLTPDRTGTVMATALFMSGMLGPVLGGPLADLCQRAGGPRRTLSVLTALALLTLPAGSFTFMHGVAYASIALIAFTTIISATCVMGATLFTIVIPNELRGMCIAILFATSTLFAIGLAPVTVSLLSGAMGGPAMLGKALAAVVASTSLFGAAAFASGVRHFPRVSHA